MRPCICAASLSSWSLPCASRCTPAPRRRSRRSGACAISSPALRASDPLARAQAACDLRELGDRAADAIAPLIALMDDATPIGEDVCENNRNWGGRDARHDHAGQAGGRRAGRASARAASRRCSAALRSPVWVARRNAAWALGALRDTRAMPPLDRSAEGSRSAGARAGRVGARRASRSARHRAAGRDA